MNEAVWIAAGFGVWATLCGVDALMGRKWKRLAKAERRVCSLHIALSKEKRDRHRDKSRFAVKLAQAELEYQEMKDRLESDLAAERARNKELRKLLEQKWKEATGNANP